MLSFKCLPLLMALIFSLTSLYGCGKKAPLYQPDIDKGDAQSDQSFVFPPKAKDQPNSTQP